MHSLRFYTPKPVASIQSHLKPVLPRCYGPVPRHRLSQAPHKSSRKAFCTALNPRDLCRATVQVNKLPVEVLRQQTMLALESRRRSEEVVRFQTAQLENTNYAIAKLQQELRAHLKGNNVAADTVLRDELQPLGTPHDMLSTVAGQTENVSRAKHQAQLAQQRAEFHGAAQAMANREAEIAQAEAEHAQHLLSEGVKGTQDIKLRDLQDSLKAGGMTTHQRTLSMILLRTLPMLVNTSGLEPEYDSDAPAVKDYQYL